MSEIKVPDLGESITEGTIFKWHVKEGDSVGQGDVLAELETDKVNLEISAEESGVISAILRGAGENVAVGEVIGRIGGGGGKASAADKGKPASPEAPVVPAAPEAPAAQQPAAPSASAGTLAAAPEGPAADSGAYLASPGARKLARERGIDLGEVGARDPIGRIGQADVETFGAAAAPAAPKPAPAAPAQGAPAGSTPPGTKAADGQRDGAQAHVAQTADDCQPPGGGAAHGGHADHLQRGGHDRDPRYPQAAQG